MENINKINKINKINNGLFVNDNELIINLGHQDLIHLDKGLYGTTLRLVDTEFRVNIHERNDILDKVFGRGYTMMNSNVAMLVSSPKQLMLEPDLNLREYVSNKPTNKYDIMELENAFNLYETCMSYEKEVQPTSKMDMKFPYREVYIDDLVIRDNYYKIIELGGTYRNAHNKETQVRKGTTLLTFDMLDHLDLVIDFIATLLNLPLTIGRENKHSEEFKAVFRKALIAGVEYLEKDIEYITGESPRLIQLFKLIASKHKAKDFIGKTITYPSIIGNESLIINVWNGEPVKSTLDFSLRYFKAIISQLYNMIVYIVLKANLKQIKLLSVDSFRAVIYYNDNIAESTKGVNKVLIALCEHEMEEMKLKKVGEDGVCLNHP